MNICSNCNTQNEDDAVKCASCSQDLQSSGNLSQTQSAGFPTSQQSGGNAQNNSGMGSTAAVPPEIAGWSWGGFLLAPIWAIGMNTWIGLLAFVPYVGWIMAIVLGVKGNEWAWQNRKWESVQQFKATQRVWTNWGIGVFIVSVVLGFLFGLLAAMLAPCMGKGGI